MPGAGSINHSDRDMFIEENQDVQKPVHSKCARLLSAFFYGISSFLLVLLNKNVLSVYRFPSTMVLGIGQLFPLPLIYIGNHLSGLASTQKLSLPMFTVLRKFAIPITLVLETIVLRKRYPLSIILSVCTIVVGAVIAAGFDLSFQLEGYLIALLSNIFTAANGVYIAIKIDPKELGKYGVLFYNASFVIIPTLFVSFITGDIHKAIEFEQWRDIVFCTQFLLSCFMGFILLYSVVLCCYYNSPLTTMVSGAIKNICIAYIGIFIGGDYTFSWLNFIGLNICMSGGLSYSILIMMSNPRDFDPVNISNNEEKYSKQDETCNGLSESEEAKPLIISDEE